MPWLPYKSYHGAVNGKRIRVPTNKSLAAIGSRAFAYSLGPGAIATLVNILPHGAQRPSSVGAGVLNLNWSFAGVIRVTRGGNTASNWASLAGAQIPGDEAELYIVRPQLDQCEIEVE